MRHRFLVVCVLLLFGIFGITACATGGSTPAEANHVSLQSVPSNQTQSKTSNQAQSTTSGEGISRSLTTLQVKGLKDYVTLSMKANHIPGMALAVIQHGKIVFFDGAGYADIAKKTPVRETTAFHIGSLTKSMTATGILQLRNAGKVNLDDPVVKYLPWFRVGGPYSSNDITLYDLLTQSSGIPASAPDTVFQMLSPSGKSSIEEGVRDLREVSMSSKAGTTYAYSNMNYSTLGLVLQQVSGQPYRQYMEQHVFEPLGMTHTTFESAASQTPSSDVAGLYRTSSGDPIPAQRLGSEFDFEDPAGISLVSTVSDMAKYVSFELGDRGQSVLPETSVKEAHTQGISAPGLGTYTYGWINVSGDNLPYVWHNGSIPGVFSLVILYPSLDTGIVQFVNTSDVPYDLGISQISAIMAE